MADSNQHSERCPVCEGVDQPGLLHNPEAPYCSENVVGDPVEDVRGAAGAIAVARGGTGDASAEWHRFDDALARLEEQLEATQSKMTSLFAGYEVKCERWSLGTCDHNPDPDGKLCRICQFFTDLGYESFEVTTGGLRSWRPVKALDESVLASNRGSEQDEFLDGFALWQELKPQSGQDWIAVAERWVAAGESTEQSSPLFAALVEQTRKLMEPKHPKKRPKDEV